MIRASGTEGYGETAAERVKQYESIPFAQVHRHMMHLFPTTPSQVIDIGAGTGRDAAGFADLGHAVTAVEPTPELRAAAKRLHPHPAITWMDDSLPDLERVHALEKRYDLVMLTAVWMHLDRPQRERAMGRVAALVRRGGMMGLSLRHGPVPAGGGCSRCRRRRRANWLADTASSSSTKAKGLRFSVDRMSGGITSPSGQRPIACDPGSDQLWPGRDFDQKLPFVAPVQPNASSHVPRVEALEYSVARFSKKLVCSMAFSIWSIHGSGFLASLR